MCLQKLEAEWCVLYSEALTEMSPLHRPCGAPELSRPQQTFHHTNTRQVEVCPWVWTGTGLPQLPTLPQGSSEGMLGVGAVFAGEQAGLKFAGRLGWNLADFIVRKRCVKTAGKRANGHGKYTSQQPENAFTPDRSTEVIFICLFAYISPLVGGQEATPRSTQAPHFVPLPATGLTHLEEPWHSDDSLWLVQTSEGVKNCIPFSFLPHVPTHSLMHATTTP